MQNTLGTIDKDDQPRISQSDKLLFCVFLAVAFHAMLLFGVGFKLPQSTQQQYDKTFNVVLAQFETENKPEKADFIGQANQEGGGDSEELISPSALEVAQFNDPDQISSELVQRQQASEITPPTTDIITSQGRKTNTREVKQQNQQQEPIPDAAALIDKSYRLTGLIASLDNQQVNQAHKGRKRTISASIHRASDALYLDSWRRKIERIGNLNYPERAKIEKIYGNLTMKVAVNKDGTVNEVAIMQSSGIKTLDDAAIRIVRLAAPFSPLTAEMAKDTDILNIIRVWQFQPDYQLKTQ